MIPDTLADRIAYAAVREALEQRATATADLYYHKHLHVLNDTSETKAALVRVSHKLAKAEGYLQGVVAGLATRYDPGEIRQFIFTAEAELTDSGIVREE